MRDPLDAFDGDGLAVALEGVGEPLPHALEAVGLDADVGGEREVAAELGLLDVEKLDAVGGEHAEECGGHARPVAPGEGDHDGLQARLKGDLEVLGVRRGGGCIMYGHGCHSFMGRGLERTNPR